MIGWLFRKKGAAPQPGAARNETKAAPAAADAPQSPAAAAAPAAIDWAAQLAQAAGDDDALVALACAGAPVDIRIAAIDAIGGEEALKRAERELRKNDRRVHRHARQRHAARVATRETRAQADRLIAAARALLDESPIAANRLVEIDRAWRALDRALLGDAQTAAFGALFQRLAALERESADRAREIVRWQAAAREAAAELASASADAAVGTTEGATLAACMAKAQAVLDAAPHGATAAAESCDALRAALHTADSVLQRIEIIDALSQPTPSDIRDASGPPPAGGVPSAAGTETEAVGDAAPATAPSPAPAVRDARQRWEALAPLADAGLTRALDALFAQVQRANLPPAPVRRTRTEDAKPDPRPRLDAVARQVEQAEAALADGLLADAGKALSAIESQLRGAAAPGPLRERIDALRAEVARLRGWQDWGGARARDELVAQAEALAAAGTDTPRGAALGAITPRQRAGLIAELRARWKELDRHGGAARRALWQRFDAALQVANAPLAEQAEARRAARDANLKARIELLTALEAVELPAHGATGAVDGGEAAPDAGPDANAAAPPPAGARDVEGGAGSSAATPVVAAPDARSIAAALSAFHTAWRKLGPIEHTVPHAERDRLIERTKAAVARVEGPLGNARRVAQAKREALIASARALAAPGALPGRDAVAAARDLQSQWQHTAKALPLARAAEAALWTDFRAAIDAVYQARHAETAARDAEFAANAAARSALVARIDAAMQAVAERGASAVRDLERTLAEVEAQWRQAGPAPRAQAAAFDARFRSARSAAQALLLDSRQQRWRQQCEALAARLAAEDADADRDAAHGDASPTPAEAIERRASDESLRPALPARWASALARRGSPPAGGAMPDDELLLRLEAAFGAESPPEQHAARRALKLQAMKDALETRSVAAAAPATADTMLDQALARSTFDAAQRERLRAVVRALASAPPPDWA